jgi:acyl carrier protein
MKENIVKIILDSIEIINSNLEKKLPVDLREKCPIYGITDGVDSISLVSLISIVEDFLENELNISLIIANEKAMSRKNSPFLNVGTLAEFVCDLINNKK